MKKHHPKNERIKRQYMIYLEDARRLSPASVDEAAASIALFESSTGNKDFALFHTEQARKFKRDLNEATNPKTGKPLAKATIRSRLNAVKGLFHYLAGQPGYKSKISYSDCDYFNQSASDERIAVTTRARPVPTLDQIRHTINLMPFATDIEKRNRALMAFAILSGARDNAIASFDIGHVDQNACSIDHDARTVRTKFSKSSKTIFFPVGDDLRAIVLDWIDYLKTERLYGEDDPLFPSTKIDLDNDGLFAPVGITRSHWKNADAIRRIFAEAFENARLPYFNPHSFRKTLVRMGQKKCRTPEEFKAWSQNLSHEKVMTTFTSYGTVDGHRQSEIMNSFKDESDSLDEIELSPEIIQKVLNHLQKGIDTR